MLREQPATQIGNNGYCLILGTACVATILEIKPFDSDLQMEWVASGQPIQFVTVMILLSVKGKRLCRFPRVH